MRLSTPRRFLHLTVGFACLLALPWAAAVQAAPSSDGSGALATFSVRVERYVAARDRLERPLPSLDSHRDGWSLMLTRRYLASTIRRTRINVRQGEFFAPPVDDLFRSLIAKATHDVEIEGLTNTDVALTGSRIDLATNEPLPRWAIQAVPDALLQYLPPLPHAIEYRIVNGALILWDLHAEILIDALPGAFTVE